MSEQAAGPVGSRRVALGRTTWGCAAGSAVTAALALVAPLFTLWHQTAPRGGGADYGGWGHVRPFGAHTSSSVAGHDTVYGIVFAVGAVVLLGGAVLLLRGTRMGAGVGVGVVITAAGSALLCGVSSTVLLDGLARRSYNNPTFHVHFGPGFWMVMVIGVFGLALCAILSLATLRGVYVAG